MTATLAGRKALITGGGRGTGRAIALAFAQEGADMALLARTRVDLERVSSEVAASGRQAYAIEGDITDRNQVAQSVQAAASQLGQIDILVNNAGLGQTHKFIGHDDLLWQRILDVNLTGTYLMTKHVVPGMVQRRWGRIINLASYAGKVGSKYMAAYTAAKHGVIGLTRALAIEFVGDGVTVNAICPAYVDTPMVAANIDNIVRRTGRTEAEARQVLEAINPQKRLLQPEEVAAMAVMLAGEQARGITGQAINVDGGAVTS